MEGWIKIHRKMREWQYYQCPSVMMVFIDLLFAANSKKGYFRGSEIERGETMISVSSIEHNTGLSRKTVIKALNMLEESGEIKRVRTKFGTKTIIKKFDTYQANHTDASVTDSGVTGGVTSGIIPPLSTPPTPPPSTPEQEYKKDKNNNILYNNITSPSNEEDVSSMADDSSNSHQQQVDFEGLKNFFNRTMSEANSVIPHIVSIKGKREGAVRARIREYGLENVYEMITKASRSDFLNGKNTKGWRADFSWLFLPTNFQKVLEGNYDNGNNSQRQNVQSGQLPGRSQEENPLVGYNKIHGA